MPVFIEVKLSDKKIEEIIHKYIEEELDGCGVTELILQIIKKASEFDTIDWGRVIQKAKKYREKQCDMYEDMFTDSQKEK